MGAQMEIRISRVLSAKSSRPAVVANVGGQRVMWNLGGGWRCSCLEPECAHMEALRGVLDPSVFDRDTPLPRAGAMA